MRCKQEEERERESGDQQKTWRELWVHWRWQRRKVQTPFPRRSQQDKLELSSESADTTKASSGIDLRFWEDQWQKVLLPFYKLRLGDAPLVVQQWETEALECSGTRVETEYLCVCGSKIRNRFRKQKKNTSSIRTRTVWILRSSLGIKREISQGKKAKCFKGFFLLPLVGPPTKITATTFSSVELPIVLSDTENSARCWISHTTEQQAIYLSRRGKE